MLATPLSAREIVGGQWRALLRLFGLPLTVFWATQLVGGVMAQHATWEQMSAAIATAGSGIPGFSALGLACALGGAGALVIVADLAAIAWFGMWMGVTSRSVNQATLKTMLYVQVIPWFVISFAAGMIVPLLLIPAMMSGAASQPNRFMLWFPLLSTGLGVVLNLAADTWFVVWARRKLYGELRERVGTKVWAPRPA
jgi:hypothetical protein